MHPLLRAALLEAGSAHSAPRRARGARRRRRRSRIGRSCIARRPRSARRGDRCGARARRRRHRARAGHLAAAAPSSGRHDCARRAERARRLILAGESVSAAGPHRVAVRSPPSRALALAPDLRSRAELLRAHVEAWRGSATRPIAATCASPSRPSGAASARYRDPELAAVALGYAAAVAVVAGDSEAALDAVLSAPGGCPAERLSRDADRSARVAGQRARAAWRQRPCAVLLDDVLGCTSAGRTGRGRARRRGADVARGPRGVRVPARRRDRRRPADRGALGARSRRLSCGCGARLSDRGVAAGARRRAESVALARDAGQGIHWGMRWLRGLSWTRRAGRRGRAVRRGRRSRAGATGCGSSTSARVRAGGVRARARAGPEPPWSSWSRSPPTSHGPGGANPPCALAGRPDRGLDRRRRRRDAADAAGAATWARRRSRPAGRGR